jgi:hypothetical protein
MIASKQQRGKNEKGLEKKKQKKIQNWRKEKGKNHVSVPPPRPAPCGDKRKNCH